MASEYTPNYNLDLYVSTDKPNLRDQYNAAMGKIDRQMKANADGVTNANANVTTMQAQVNRNKEGIADATEGVSSLETAVGAHATQIGSLQTAVERQGAKIAGVEAAAGNALSKANGNASGISELRSDVSSLTARAGDVESTANSALSKANANSSSISNLQTDVEGVQSGLNEANARVSNLSGSPCISATLLFTSASGVKSAFNLESPISEYDFIRVHFQDGSRKYCKLVPVTGEATQSVEVSRAVIIGVDEYLMSSATLLFSRTGTSVQYEFGGQIHHIFSTDTVGYEGCDIAITAVYGISFATAAV